ncbi:C5a anaphylatoxin chemotactic receptor 1 [Sphaeramia orbicularis]|uniref:C5a anaphylatoxin chemotactic receptor 1-like n=1 Tax=Sphaeramia orbicularis TaxID=375764 RepID=A0A673BYQ4_9TELE|nr:C5a anaphylatoxin chemotactic receptor 1-like [Sphaeramia orbicularis]
MDYYDGLGFNYTIGDDYTPPDFSGPYVPKIQPIQIAALVCYGLVILLGVPGNAVVVWVTGFCMPHSVTSLWFLNLALADLLCCLSLPLLMVPLAHDGHWHFGSLACTLLRGVFYLVMFCSVLQLALISLDRWLLVSRPVWCQNKRRPRKAGWVILGVWCLSLIFSIHQFVHTAAIDAGTEKKECNQPRSWFFFSFRFVVGFILPFLIIVICHWKVYGKTSSGLSNGTRSKKTLKIIVAVILSFFLCWLPLHIVDMIMLLTPRSSTQYPLVYHAEVMTVCLAYFNSCLNPLLYVCLGRGFKNTVNRSLRSVLHFITEEPQNRMSTTNNDTKSSSTGREITKV